MSRPTIRFGKLTQRAILCAMALSLTAPVWGQSGQVVSIEEHWELRLAQPDPDRSAPQTTMVVSPNGNVDGVHFLFTLNHAMVPDYVPGGMQVQFWDGGSLLDTVSAGSGTLSSNEEVVRWVHRLSLEDGNMKFQVSDGQSETWGPFGGDELTVSQPTSFTSLNQYRPAVSLTESQVNYAENRVTSLTLTKLVWVTADGDRHELVAPIALDTSLDQ
jgi:hypothetical protein